MVQNWTKLAFLGDVHGDLERVHAAAFEAAALGADVLIQVGDLGFTQSSLRELAGMVLPLPALFLEGNHEHHEVLDLSPGFHQINFRDAQSSVKWSVGRGSIGYFGGHEVAFMGGGDSIDKGIRLRRNMHWSPEEVIPPLQIEQLLVAAKGPQLLVTHAAPQSLIEQHFDNSHLPFTFGVPANWIGTGSSLELDRLWKGLGYPFLVCGHMHRSVEGPLYRMLDIGELWLLDLTEL